MNWKEISAQFEYIRRVSQRGQFMACAKQGDVDTVEQCLQRMLAAHVVVDAVLHCAGPPI